MKERDEDKALRVNGCAVVGGRLKHEYDVDIRIVSSLHEFVKIITELDHSYPLYYRGHPDVNYLVVPQVLRCSVGKENILIKQFSQSFFSEIARRTTMIEKLAFMQHYRLYTRCLDMSTNPFVSLFFACYSDSQSRKEDETGKWGEVLVFRETVHNNQHGLEDIKYVQSMTTSVIANVAKMGKTFDLGELHASIMEDGHCGQIKNFVKFQDIISQSIILKTPLDNDHIRNQQGVFVLCNANRICEILDCNGKKLLLDYDDLTSEFLTDANADFSYAIKERFDIGRRYLYGIDEWDIKFEKVDDLFDRNHPIERMRKDPFNIERLRYREKGKRIAILIEPDAKPVLLRQLSSIGINNTFIYSDMDKVAAELNKK